MSTEIWAEKYRPRTLNEIVDRESIVRRLKGFVRERNLPHLLFVGPAGSGKTASILALARDLYGENYEAATLELNASDHRGIDIIRGRVKTFARTGSLGDVPFRLIIMDEADNLTRDAQQALRRTMEKWKTVRFCLIGNFQSKIIDPIQSRCALFVFTRYSGEIVAERLKYIGEKENVALSEDGLQTIVGIAQGDLRRAINILQSASALGVVDRDTIYDVISRVRPEEVSKMLVGALKGNFVEARQLLRELLIDRGLSGFDVVKSIYPELFKLQIPEDRRLELLSTLADIDYRLTQGATDEVQLGALLAKLVLAGSRIRSAY